MLRITIIFFCCAFSALYSFTAYCGQATIHQIVSMDTKTGKMHLDTNANFVPTPFDWPGTFTLCTQIAGAAYVSLFTYLLYKGYRLLRTDSWALWHEEVTLQALYQLPQKTVANELLTAIKAQYPHAYNAVDAVARFIEAANQEIYHLEKFRTIHMTLDLLNLSIILPRQKDKLQAALERIERLNYLKQVIWFASIETPAAAA